MLSFQIIISALVYILIIDLMQGNKQAKLFDPSTRIFTLLSLKVIQ
jgi:hypothetical protein